MHGIYAYIPETNYVPMEYSVAAILLLLFMVLISLVSVLNLLYFYISTFRSMCAVPSYYYYMIRMSLVTAFCAWSSLEPAVIPIIIIIIIIIIRYECLLSQPFLPGTSLEPAVIPNIIIIIIIIII